MTKDMEKEPSRREFLKVTSIGAVSLATGGLLGSASGAEGKPQEATEAANGPRGKEHGAFVPGHGCGELAEKNTRHRKRHWQGERCAASRRCWSMDTF